MWEPTLWVCRRAVHQSGEWEADRHPSNGFHKGLRPWKPQSADPQTRTQWHTRPHSYMDQQLSQGSMPSIVDGHHSSYVSIRSGVPQGSVLGFCLFLANISDLLDKLMVLARLFADDTAVYRVVANSEQQDQLQQDLQRLSEWEKSWDMLFHPAKCVSMPVTRSRSPLDHSYVLHGHNLDTVHTAKYLGVTLHWEMTFIPTSARR